uniref:Uncharacterized protein n=1 Tax=Myotis myotis TaxID=51298 RepID=A0A7J7YE51_MYOMY|nr:hypothetical protein mMyoMyo1_011151 [Myotis myotis]
MPVKVPGVPESQLLEVTGIAIPEEWRKGTAIFIAGVSGNEELDDIEIPALKITGLIHLLALINKYFPSSEHSRPRTPINLWLDSPENAKSLGNDDFEVARSMYPFRERSIIRRSWEELLEAPLNNEGLHILQTIPAEQKEIGYLQLPPKEENQATTSLRSHHLHVLQGPFPLLPQRTKLRRQHSHISPRYSDVRSQKLIAPMLKVNPEEKHFLPSDHALFTRENTKKENIKEPWQNAILSASGGHSINPSIANSTSMRGKLGIPGDNGRHLRDNIRVPIDNVIIPMANVGGSMDNSAVPLNNFGVPRGNLEVPRGLGGVPRRVVSSPLIELSKIGEHRL